MTFLQYLIFVLYLQVTKCNDLIFDLTTILKMETNADRVTCLKQLTSIRA